jgi:macrodomain Ter protein organizer (MatP/YcbG family)
MAKKERLGTDPLKGGPLSWISDTRKEKKPEEKEDNTDVKTSKRQSTKTSKRLNAKTPKRHDTKKPVTRKRHTIYLSASLSKKLRVYAAANDMQLSEVVEKLINDNI